MRVTHMGLQWLSLIAAIWLQSINGTNSNFPAYSSELKAILSISQLRLNNLASANDAGKLLGWIPGLAAGHLPLWLVLLVGSSLGLVGYGVQFLLLSHTIHSLPYWQVFSLTVLAGNSICWINTVVNIVAVKNFPFDRQIAVGLATSYAGLSAMVYTAVVNVVESYSRREKARLFLLLNSVLPLLVCIVASPFARDIVDDVRKSKNAGARRFVTMFVITILTGLFSVFTSLRVLPPLLVLLGVFVFLSLPLLIPLSEKLEQTGLVHDEGVEIRVHKDQENGRDFLEIGVIEEIGPRVMLRRVDFWLYFFVYLFGGTLGLVYLNNLGQIAESRGCNDISSLVSFSSAFGFFGRLLPSILEYFFAKNKCVISRAAAIGGTMIPMCVAFFTLSGHQISALYTSTALISLCTGAITSLAVAATSELFGTENFAVNHNIVISNIPLGSFLFGDLAALLYNRGRNPGQENCIGHQCYHTTFIVWAFLCLLGILLAFVLHKRTNKSLRS